MNKQEQEQQSLELTKENIAEWKAELRKEMLERHTIDRYDETLSDEDWLADYIGQTPDDVIDGETESWEE